MSRPCQLPLLLAVAFLAAGGCSSTGGQLGTLQTQNRSLLEQNKAQLAEIENLKSHTRRLEDRLIDTEQQLSASERRTAPDRSRLVSQGSDRAASMFDRPADEPDQNGTADGSSDRRLR